MNPFEYARPETEAEALDFLSESGSQTAVLAGGTDLVSLLREGLIDADRVVDIKHVDSFRGVSESTDGLLIGALTTLEELLESPLLSQHQALRDVAEAHHAIQIQQNGTIGGDLCHLPNCWYFRNGYGLLAMRDGASLVEAGDNRYHAILGNHGPAKFVNASRLAPACIAWGAKVRIAGPKPEDEQWIPLEYFYTTPNTPRQGVTVLKPGQLLTHVLLPFAERFVSASYEVLELNGLDWPTAAASAWLDMTGGVVTQARIVLGHVAPVPWVSREAAAVLIGRSVSEESAQAAGDNAVGQATPLAENEYKVQQARTAVKRAILRAVGEL